MNEIIFTIIIPFYATEHYIGQTLDSIKNQVNFDLSKVQVIVVNDGYDYDLTDMIKSYQSSIPNIEYIKKENGNWGSIINYVKNNQLIKGKYVTVLDSDDLLLANCLSTFEEKVNTNADMIISNFYKWKSANNKFTNYKVYYLKGNRLHSINDKNLYKFKTPMSFPLCKFYKTEIFNTIDGLREKVSYQDINLYFSCLFKSKTVFYINKQLGLWRNDRKDSSTNLEWSKNKVDQWIDTLKYYDSIDCTLLAYYYSIVKGFKTNYLKHYNNKITFTNKTKNVYTPKILFPLVWVFTRILKCRNRKIFE